MFRPALVRAKDAYSNLHMSSQLMISTGFAVAEYTVPELNRSFLFTAAKVAAVDHVLASTLYGLPKDFTEHLGRLYIKEQDLLRRAAEHGDITSLPLRSFLSRSRLLTGLIFKIDDEQAVLKSIRDTSYELMDPNARCAVPEHAALTGAYLSGIRRMLAEPLWLNSQFMRFVTGLTPELLYHIEIRPDFSLMRACFREVHFKLRCNPEDLINMLKDQHGEEPVGKKATIRLLHSIISDTPLAQPDDTFTRTQNYLKCKTKTDFRRQLMAISPGVVFGSSRYTEILRDDTIFSPDMTVLCMLYAYGVTVSQAKQLLPESAALCPGRFQTVHNKMRDAGLITNAQSSAMNVLKLSDGYALGVSLFTMLNSIMKTTPKADSGYPHPFTYLAVYSFFQHRICRDLKFYDKNNTRWRDLWGFPAFIKIVLETLSGKTIIEEVKCPRCGRSYMAIRNTPRLYPCPFCRGTRNPSVEEESEEADVSDEQEELAVDAQIDAVLNSHDGIAEKDDDLLDGEDELEGERR